jgi:hypothetical protein
MEMDIKEYLEKKRELEQATKKNGKQIVHDFVKEFMAENPQVQAIRWYQYTPYFNDGEACVFSVQDAHFSVTEPSEEDMDQHPEESDAWVNVYNAEGNAKKAYTAFNKTICGDLESLMETAFGDHVHVIVLKDSKGKLTFRVDHYEHD